MPTIKTKYSPSVNIVRDNISDFNYIPTSNAEAAFNTIISEGKSGVHSHVLIGSYGTGKSSFLLALKQTLEKSKQQFAGNPKAFKSLPKFDFISLVGDYSSFEGFFAKHFGLGKNYSARDILSALENEYRVTKRKGKGLAILVDEFGKFLEYASKNNPESELYFIQQLSEWANDSTKDILFISTLHQDFSAYALHLNKLQRQEWDKVKGRIKEIPFNEPVEQLLFLASERINQRFPKKKYDSKKFQQLFECIKKAKAFPLRDYFQIEFAHKLYPFDILSASILTLSLQRYGQNERSLFSFIESNDHLGINEMADAGNDYYSIPRVYDYLLNGYYSFLTTKYNPHYAQWSSIRIALERIEGVFTDLELQRSAEDVLKLIGLLNIFSTASAKLEPAFYFTYAKIALVIANPEEIIKQLEARKIIRYVNHSFRYILSEGTDLDFEIAIDDAGRLVEKVTNVVNHLIPYFEFPFISAKSVYYKTGTPRFFQFKLTEEPIELVPEGEVDGFINLVFSEDEGAEKNVERCSAECKEAVLFGYYTNTSEIRNLLFEIHKIKKVIDGNSNDRAAVKELNSILDHYVKLLNHYVLDNIYSDNGSVIWYFSGKRIKVKNRHSFNQLLSRISEETYTCTPVFINELVNKTKISSQISVARKKLVSRLLNSPHKIGLDFSDTEFPPEKSIYLTLLKKTGIHGIKEGAGILKKPEDASFLELWGAGEKFLESTRTKERNLSEFINILAAKPFKLKQGFMEFWIPIFLLAKADEFAIYENDTYIPLLTDDIFDLINRRPSLFSIKAFDVVGIKLELFNRYRIFLNQAESKKPNNRIFIQTIRPFLSFYRELPEYSKKTNRLDKKTLALRKVIAEAKDPEKAFFDDFPIALGYSLQELQKKPEQAEKYIKSLQDSIREMRSSYDSLVDRFEKYFVHEIIGVKKDFPDYRKSLQMRFQGLKTHLLLPHQKTFLSRIESELDDRKAWLSSIAQACVGKILMQFSDADEAVLYEKVRDFVYELDNLSDLSKEQINEDTEDLLKLEITSIFKGINRNMVRIPKGKNKAIETQVNKVKSSLGPDTTMNITALTKVLQELLQHE